VTVKELLLDPTPACVPDKEMATGRYRVETSADGKAFAEAATGEFTAADVGSEHAVPLKAGTGANVRAGTDQPAHQPAPGWSCDVPAAGWRRRARRVQPGGARQGADLRHRGRLSGRTGEGRRAGREATRPSARGL
jgi:hypothetical protein